MMKKALYRKYNIINDEKNPKNLNYFLLTKSTRIIFLLFLHLLLQLLEKIFKTSN